MKHARPPMDKFKDECGVFGIYGHPEAANMTYLGLYALQHRGQESAGIASADGGKVRVSRAMGYVADNFDEQTLNELRGRLAIGHVRYSTAGESKLLNAQPILIDCAHGQIALCHNGNLVNAGELRDELVKRGSIFQTNSDTEVVLHLYARSSAACGGGHHRVDQTGAGRVLARVRDQRSPRCRKRSAWLPSSGDRTPGPGPDRVLGNLCPGLDRRQLRARRGTWRSAGHRT